MAKGWELSLTPSHDKKRTEKHKKTQKRKVGGEGGIGEMKEGM